MSPTTAVVGYKYFAIFDGSTNLSTAVVEDDDIVVAHDASRGTRATIVQQSLKTTA